MIQVPTWTHQDFANGDCYRQDIGTAKPPGFDRLQADNDYLKHQLATAQKQIRELSGPVKPDPAITAEIDALKQQVATLTSQLSSADAAAEQRLHDTIQKDRQRPLLGQQSLAEAKEALARQKAAIDAERDSLAKVREEVAVGSVEVGKWKKYLATEIEKLREQQSSLAERESAIATQQTLEERQQAIIDGDFSSITRSLVADIARLEGDVATAHTRLMAADKAHPDSRREERQQWHTIYATATKELRAVKQQLIQLPRESSGDPRQWKDRLVELLALAMDKGNVSARTLNEFVARSTGMMASRDARKVIASKALAR